MNTLLGYKSRINPIYKRSELKYLISFRKINQMRLFVNKKITNISL